MPSSFTQSTTAPCPTSGCGSCETYNHVPPPPLPPRPATVCALAGCTIPGGPSALFSGPASSSSAPLPACCCAVAVLRPSTKTLTRPAQLLVVTKPVVALTLASSGRMPTSTVPLGDASEYSASGTASCSKILLLRASKPGPGKGSVVGPAIVAYVCLYRIVGAHKSLCFLSRIMGMWCDEHALV